MSVPSRSSIGIEASKSIIKASPPVAGAGDETFAVFEVPISCLSMDEAVAQVSTWAADETSAARVINFANVHMLAESRLDVILKTALQNADLNLPDGRPVSWVGKFMFGSRVSQISGPDFMPQFCEGFFRSATSTLFLWRRPWSGCRLRGRTAAKKSWFQSCREPLPTVSPLVQGGRDEAVR